MYTHHKVDHEFPRGTPTTISYMVCSVPRCGSSLLCELLCNTQLAGAPTEFFDAQLMSEFRGRWGSRSLEDYLRDLLERKTSPNGVFGIKVHWGQLGNALGEADPAELFPGLRYVHMRREDRLRQAVSWVRALQTNQWASTHELRGEPAFDAAKIALYLERIDAEESQWHAFFEHRRITPHTVTYRALVDSPQGTVRDVLAYLGVPGAAAAVCGAPTLLRQADVVTDEWVERYLANRD